jgi:hypothetical protein
MAQNMGFPEGSSLIGLRDLGIGYSSEKGNLVSISPAYQYFIKDNLAIGAAAFYTSILDDEDLEKLGFGPIANYYTFINSNWFIGIDQDVMFSKYNGNRDDVSSFYGTTGASINYKQSSSSTSIGLGYRHSYALDGERVYDPGQVAVVFNIFR